MNSLNTTKAQGRAFFANAAIESGPTTFGRQLQSACAGLNSNLQRFDDQQGDRLPEILTIKMLSLCKLSLTESQK